MIAARLKASVPGYDLGAWLAVFLPANAPKDVSQKLAEICGAVMTTDKAREFLRRLGADPFPGSPDSLAKLVESEIAKWGRLIRAAGIESE